MPPVETWSAAAPATREPTFTSTPQKNPGQPAAGDDFDSAMKAALAPHHQKPQNKIQPRPGKNQPGIRQFSPGSAPADAASDSTDITVAAENNSPEKTSADKKEDATSDGKGGASSAVGKNSWEVNSPLMTAMQSPIPLLLPGKLGAVENVSADNSQTDAADNIMSGVLPLADNAALTTAPPASAKSAELDSAGKIDKTEAKLGEAEGGINLPLKSLSPVTPAEAAALSAELNPPLGKDSLVAGPAPTPGTANETQMKLDVAPSADGNMAAGKGNSTSAEALERAAEMAGTGVATTLSSMKNPQKTNKVAGPDVKVLPVDETGVAREKSLPPVLLATPVRAADNRGTDLNFSFANGNSNAPVADKTPALNVLDLPSLADARLRAVERAHDMMTLHSMRLVESKSDSLSVVIKPAVGTELSLELRLRDGGVEAQAKVTRGDGQFLDQHWPELQQRLELRGIKLAPLGGELGFSAGGNENFSRQQAAREEAAQRASAFAEFASISSAGGATARLAPIHDGWESWA